MLATSSIRLDLLFAINFIIDLCLLWFAGNISWARPRLWRVALAAGVGASAALLPVWAPGVIWPISGPAIVVISIIMVLLMVWPCTLRQLVAVLGGLWIASGITGGAAMLLKERMAPGSVAMTPTALVGVGVGIALVGVQVVWQTFRERTVVREALRQLQIRFGEESVVLTGLVDSGNSLRSFVTRCPIAVVEAEPLRRLLPPAVVEALTMGWDALDAIPERWRYRCQLIPYSTVGSVTAALLVVASDGMAIWDEKTRRWVGIEGMVGLSLQPLGPDGHYQALLSPRMLQEVEAK